MQNETRMVAHADPFFDGVGIYIRLEGRDVRGFELADQREAGMYVAPAVHLDRAAAQALANSLWEAGIRPAQGQQSEGLVSAQSAHLADMRHIAFARLELSKPEAAHG